MHEYKAYVKPSLFLGGGILLVIFSLFAILQSGILKQNKVEIIDTSATSTVSKTESASQHITVEVAGAVAHPGVYSLSVGSRVQDALLLAGNYLPSADISVIEKTINRAAKLSDGQKIYIPTKGEGAVAPVLGSQSSLININTGSEYELESLPGIGPVTAQKVISGRPYGSIEELTSRNVVSASVFEKIKDLVTLY